MTAGQRSLRTSSPRAAASASASPASSVSRACQAPSARSTSPSSSASSAAGGQAGRIARRLGELPEAVLDRAVLRGERDQGDILIEGGGDVAERVQALAALAAQLPQPIPLGEPERRLQELGHATGGAVRLVTGAQGVERVEARRGRGAFVA